MCDIHLEIHVALFFLNQTKLLNTTAHAACHWTGNAIFCSGVFSQALNLPCQHDQKLHWILNFEDGYYKKQFYMIHYILFILMIFFVLNRFFHVYNIRLFIASFAWSIFRLEQNSFESVNINVGPLKKIKKKFFNFWPTVYSPPAHALSKAKKRSGYMQVRAFTAMGRCFALSTMSASERAHGLVEANGSCSARVAAAFKGDFYSEKCASTLRLELQVSPVFDAHAGTVKPLVY